ncbi:MAG: hypothetical protein RIS94_3094 [Pseudomonadota bacterium]|jgi:type IV secretion system protein VirB11
MKPGIYLERFLAPLRPHLSRAEVTDIWINRPGELWIETLGGGIERHTETAITAQALERLARQVASTSHQGFNREHPLLSASLPDGSRVQLIGPPATREGVALAIRRHTMSDMSLASLGEGGLFEAVDAAQRQREEAELQSLLDRGEYRDFLAEAVRRRKTILLSGGTSSGKTTLLNALLKEIPLDERLIVIEDTPEILLGHPNAVGLIAARGEQGEAKVDADSLLQACLRMRPDRILLGELRGAEAFAFLRAVNTGHPGSITTIHADSAAGAIDQVAMLGLLHGARIDWDAMQAYIRQVIDVVVQLERSGRARRVTEIVYNRRADCGGYFPAASVSADAEAAAEKLVTAAGMVTGATVAS